MKPHLEVKLRPGVPAPDAPYWEHAIRDKAGTNIDIDRALAELLARYDVPVIATRAYAPHGAHVVAGGDRFRIQSRLPARAR